MEVNNDLTEKGQRDKRLIEQALAGSQAAYGELMSNYEDSIYFLVLKMVRDKEEAEDLKIEIFGKAFLKLEQYTTQFAFSTWLFRIASNHCIDFIRKKRMKTFSIDQQDQESENGTWSLDIRSENKDPEEAFIHQQKIKLMREEVTKLKEPYQELVTLRYFEELSYDEIADQLSLPLGTVKAQLFRARAMLSDMLENSRHSI
ncbi:RNA polymerase sigma factor [Acidiluteibacter ferrifornacis]|uniref:Sigma-70 family RNA polymerase sigma factor n=1 Tax=Acidiluteibacter ferrifornacis TaxID=2692424 RepID=A0A6N9NMS8_9FLAO|nr:sigma-70 family RNA polymerase sigma factor [Acidiluteibacter ferrifornacis]NBG66520.1 sigma-70 family RNA polymerase sigma factor [Acidiluteibacter ferrifornacis]